MGCQAGSVLRILVDGPLQLTQPNQCGCSPAELGTSMWVKKTKSVSLQDRERSLWNTKCHCSGSYLLVVLTNTAIKMSAMKLMLQLHSRWWQKDKTRSERVPSYAKLWKRTCKKFLLTQTRKIGWGASSIALCPNSMHIYKTCHRIKINVPYKFTFPGRIWRVQSLPVEVHSLPVPHVSESLLFLKTQICQKTDI